jgi:hypothetical protein
MYWYIRPTDFLSGKSVLLGCFMGNTRCNCETWKNSRKLYERVSKSSRTGHQEQELQMVEVSATRCSCIAILWVSLVNFVAITLCVASQRVFIIVSMYFVMDSVRELLDTHSYSVGAFLQYNFGSRRHAVNWGLGGEHACSEQLCPNYRAPSSDTGTCAMSFPTISQHHRHHMPLLWAGRSCLAFCGSRKN